MNPSTLKKLPVIFSTPVFTEGERPEGGQGEAAFWLPLLALFTGSRLSELAGLKVSDVTHEELIGADCVYIVPDVKAGRRLKNKHSARAVPIHQQLIAIGFLDFADAQRKVRGAEAWLLPEVAPSTTGVSASKWFGRYIGAHGVTDPSESLSLIQAQLHRRPSPCCCYW